MSNTIFTEVQQRTLPRNKFDMSFDNKLSTDFGLLPPCLCMELMPGDEVVHQHEVYVQFAPLNALMMHRFYVKTEYFFVPNRLVYEQFNEFLVGGEYGTDVLTPPCMTMKQLNDNGQFAPRTLSDYLGLPSSGTFGSFDDARLINSMPYRAYQLVYNDWYRDENLINKLEIPKIGGLEDDNDIPMLTTLRRRAWRKDYFTSQLPWPQKGPQVQIPLGDVAYVYAYLNERNPNVVNDEVISTPQIEHDVIEANGLLAADSQGNVRLSGDSTNAQFNRRIINFLEADYSTPGTAFYYGQNGEPDTQARVYQLVADLRSATATSIEELRRAYAVQSWLELNAIGGTRDVEQIYSHFGVKVPDYRLGRPEYIAGYSNQINVGNVYSTESNGASTNNVQAYPVSVVNGKSASESFKYYAHEHGYLIGIVSVVPKAAYFQGLPRILGRRMDKFDYYWPEFSQLGEQPVYAEEVYLNNNENNVMGYTPRYAEFKFADDQIHGDYRTQLNYQHDAPIYSREPALNQDFIEVNPSVQQLNRIFNTDVPGEHHIYIDIYHNISKVSSMVYFGNPKIY